jgi:DNA-binding PadR family transcriptional regulator
MEEGLVTESGYSDDQRRRYYRLTDTGAIALGAELERMRAALEAATRLGLLPEAEPA